MFEPSTLRRIAVRALAVFAGVAAVTSVAMPSAFADNTYFSTLDVSPPSAGSIDSVDSNFNQIHCGADAPGPCTITDQQTELGARPTSGWYTYQLQASNGPAGYSWKWTSGCSGFQAVCTVLNDQDFTSVGGEWVDTQFPQITTLRVPSWGRQPVEVSAAASDNGPIQFFVWTICHAGTTDCTNQFSDTGLTYLTGLADGQYDIQVYAVDTGLNGSAAASSTITIDSVAPDLTVTAPRANQTIDSFAATVHLSVADPGLWDVRCSIDGGEQQGCGDGWISPFLENGVHTVSVQARDQAGNETTVQRRFTVVDPQVTLIGTPESVYGQRASISVQVPKNSTAQVEFDDASTGLPLCIKAAPANGKTTCTFSGKHFRPGTHDVFVRFTGDAMHKFANATFSYTVDKAPATMSAVVQDGRYGATYPVQVTGLPEQATGTVEFRVGETLLCTAHVRASAAACSVGSRELEPGDYRVTASYLGNDTYLGVARSFRLTVAKGLVPLTATNSDIAPAIAVGESVTLTARGLPGNATGSVVFTSNGLTLCSAKVQRGAATCETGTDLPVGTYVTTASYSGDVHYLRAGARTTFSVA
jgi:hypothetical protein